jgi:hypothetical protein
VTVTVTRRAGPGAGGGEPSLEVQLEAAPRSESACSGPGRGRLSPAAWRLGAAARRRGLSLTLRASALRVRWWLGPDSEAA